MMSMISIAICSIERSSARAHACARDYMLPAAPGPYRPDTRRYAVQVPGTLTRLWPTGTDIVSMVYCTCIQLSMVVFS